MIAVHDNQVKCPVSSDALAELLGRQTMELLSILNENLLRRTVCVISLALASPI
jgi:hypothetical protein